MPSRKKRSSATRRGAAIALTKDGKLTALAVTSVTRLSALPDAPSLAEAAGMAGFDAVLACPRRSGGNARANPRKLNAEMRRITIDPEFQNKILARGLDPLPPRSIAKMKTYIRSEQERRGGVVRAMGLAGSQEPRLPRFGPYAFLGPKSSRTLLIADTELGQPV